MPNAIFVSEFCIVLVFAKSISANAPLNINKNPVTVPIMPNARQDSDTNQPKLTSCAFSSDFLVRQPVQSDAKMNTTKMRKLSLV